MTRDDVVNILPSWEWCGGYQEGKEVDVDLAKHLPDQAQSLIRIAFLKCKYKLRTNFHHFVVYFSEIKYNFLT